MKSNKPKRICLAQGDFNPKRGRGSAQEKAQNNTPLWDFALAVCYHPFLGHKWPLLSKGEGRTKNLTPVSAAQDHPPTAYTNRHPRTHTQQKTTGGYQIMAECEEEGGKQKKKEGRKKKKTPAEIRGQAGARTWEVSKGMKIS